MNTRKLFLTAAALLCIAVTSCAQEVKNVIFLIGDGMGIGAVSALAQGDDNCALYMGNPAVGLSETSCANRYVTDSPAGGTALATGTKTNYGYLGMGPDGEDLVSSMDIARGMGKKTGIVVNTILTEATPASFYACAKSRVEQHLIARQFTESNVDVAIGGGLAPFINRPDNIDLTSVLIDKGYDVYLDWTSLINTTSGKYVAILPDSNIHRKNSDNGAQAMADERNEVCMAAQMAASKADPGEVIPLDPREYLVKAVAKGIESLENNKKGFYLMIESAIIDGYGHNNDSNGHMEEMGEFNALLSYLVNYVETHPKTLLVVTADHETGDTAVDQGEKGKDGIKLMYGTHGHTGNLVPVFAYGAGKHHFSKVMKNSDISPIIVSLMKK